LVRPRRGQRQVAVTGGGTRGGRENEGHADCGEQRGGDAGRAREVTIVLNAGANDRRPMWVFVFHEAPLACWLAPRPIAKFRLVAVVAGAAVMGPRLRALLAAHIRRRSERCLVRTWRSSPAAATFVWGPPSATGTVDAFALRARPGRCGTSCSE